MIVSRKNDSPSVQKELSFPLLMKNKGNGAIALFSDSSHRVILIEGANSSRIGTMGTFHAIDAYEEYTGEVILTNK